MACVACAFVAVLPVFLAGSVDRRVLLGDAVVEAKLFDRVADVALVLVGE